MDQLSPHLLRPGLPAFAGSARFALVLCAAPGLPRCVFLAYRSLNTCSAFFSAIFHFVGQVKCLRNQTLTSNSLRSFAAVYRSRRLHYEAMPKRIARVRVPVCVCNRCDMVSDWNAKNAFLSCASMHRASVSAKLQHEKFHCQLKVQVD